MTYQILPIIQRFLKRVENVLENASHSVTLKGTFWKESYEVVLMTRLVRLLLTQVDLVIGWIVCR